MIKWPDVARNIPFARQLDSRNLVDRDRGFDCQLQLTGGRNRPQLAAASWNALDSPSFEIALGIVQC